MRAHRLLLCLFASGSLAVIALVACGSDEGATDAEREDAAASDATRATSDGSDPAGDGGGPRDDGGSGGADAGGDGGQEGGSPSAPSCASLPDACGAGESCCATRAVTGGTYARSFDGVTQKDAGYPATVGAFYLDRYEVTVGRYRAFLAAGQGVAGSPPPAGAGAHPKLPNSGWSSSWNAALPASVAAIEARFQSCQLAGQATWTTTPGANEAKPINCLDWYAAFAFCAWDGGRLPTEAEWNYVAAGGDEQRVYPWTVGFPPGCTVGDPSVCIDAGHAVYTVFKPSPPIAQVGSRSPLGDGLWGQADLAGNVWEWTLDYASTSAPVGEYPLPCSDCAQLDPPSSGVAARTLRGGSHTNPAPQLTTGFRNAQPPTFYETTVGVRCARDLP